MYSTYEAKAKLGEIIRKVRAGGTVVITYRGRPVAEVRPLSEEAGDLGRRLERLAETGVLSPAARPGELPHPVARKRGALQRFLETLE